MNWLKAEELERLAEGRPRLMEWMQERPGVRVAILTDRPTTREADIANKKAPFLLAETAKGKRYLINTRPGTGKDSEGKRRADTLLVWLADDLGGEPAPGFMLIDKSKLGRPRRVLTDKEKLSIDAWRAAGEGVNRIAGKLHCNNRLVMEYVREKENGQEGKREGLPG